MMWQIGNVRTAWWVAVASMFAVGSPLPTWTEASGPCAPPAGTSAIEFQSGKNTLRDMHSEKLESRR
jgi:hypothetical protein